MNRIVLAPTVLALTFFTTCANANIDQLKGLLGGKKAESTVTSSSLTEMATSAASNIDLASLVSSVAGNLNVSENQSEGGIASIMNYVQGNLSGADYAQLASSIPGIDSLLEDVPSLSGNSAASSSSSTDMIASFVTQISSYLNVNADEETQALFKSGLDNLLTAL